MATTMPDTAGAAPAAPAADRSWPTLPDPDGQPDPDRWAVIVGNRRVRSTR